MGHEHLAFGDFIRCLISCRAIKDFEDPALPRVLRTGEHPDDVQGYTPVECRFLTRVSMVH